MMDPQELRSKFHGVVKAMMELIGLTGGPVRPPLVEVSEDEVKELKRMLEGWAPVL
ncbi:MAG: hypothetical protein AABN95_16240 [Acidobacteriota bacterium]